MNIKLKSVIETLYTAVHAVKYSIVNIMIHPLCESYCTVAVYLVTGSEFVGAYLHT